VLFIASSEMYSVSVVWLLLKDNQTILVLDEESAILAIKRLQINHEKIISWPQIIFIPKYINIVVNTYKIFGKLDYTISQLTINFKNNIAIGYFINIP
jgi:hypothetical protein